ncbi:MAG: RNB domain-containing ribonuclease, partial [Victivallales bacterium]|nr:RNB domain-containing ribonuclease [Victivallales bacterium]
PVPAAHDEKRLDLTHLASFAIDDDGCQDPDDAVSVDGEAIWIHVADPAAVAAPDSPIDLEARDRGSNAYLPEKMVKMLPDEMTTVFGLGLSDTSPALSFKIVIDADGAPTCEKVELSVIAAKMVSYEEAERRISEDPFSALAKFAAANRERREANGAFSLSLPEVKVTARFNDGSTPLEHDLAVGGRMETPERMEISPYPELESREMIAELMVMAGEAVGKFLREHEIPAPFAGQAPPENPIGDTDSLSAMFACRRQLRRTQLHTSPARHAGLGLDTYTRVTSPLRRYSDLLVHQQLRAFLKGEALISEEEMLERMSQGETGAFRATISERRSSQHWKLVNLKERDKPSVSATIVEVMDNRCKLLIPELAIDATLRNPGEVTLDEEIELKLAGVDIPELDARWRK